MAGLLFWVKRRAPAINKNLTLTFRSIDWSYTAPLGFIVLAVGGAVRLNNGVSNILTILLLLLIALDFHYLFKRSRVLSQGKIIFHIFCIGLSLLLMTSLRGWFITGHDVQREYYVFELAKSHWHWQVSAYRDPYNACLSITVLPTMFASFMKLADPTIYKVLFQVLFACCPAAVYVLVKRISNGKLAILSTIYFVAFPTFFMDMPMLNRQEVAFLFFTALLLLLTDVKSRYKPRSWLFGLFGLGIVVSHYSTTYALLLIFISACSIRLLFERRVVRRIAEVLFKKLHRATPDFIGKPVRRRLITVPMIFCFALVAFLWNVQITHSSNGFIDTIKSAAKSITSNIQHDSRSSDTSVSLFGGASVDPAKLVQDYRQEQEDIRAASTANNYYQDSTYAKYTISAAPDKPLPLTRLGRGISALKINVYDLNYVTRQSFARILQLLVLIGLGMMFFSKRLKLHPGSEYIAASMSSIFFLAVLVFVPVLSVDYGLLRAFQQVLIVLALPVAIGSLTAISFFTKKRAIGLTFLLSIVFFLTSTGVVAELTGGYIAPLHLHNTGTYYDSYYVHPGEGKAIAWLSSEKGSADVAADHAMANRVEILSNFAAKGPIYPALLRKDSFVILGYTYVQKNEVYAEYQNQIVQYMYPAQFLNENKNLLYSNQQSRIYK